MKTRLFALVISVAALWPATAHAARCSVAPSGTLTLHFVASDSNNFGYVLRKVDGRWGLGQNPCPNPSNVRVTAIEVTEDPGVAMHPAFELSSIVDGTPIVPVTILANGASPSGVVDDLLITGTAGADELALKADQSISIGGERWITSRGLRRVQVESGGGDDRLVGDGFPAVLRLYAGDGDDTLGGGSSGDDLRGEAGNDQFIGSGGGDYMDAGAGDDLINTFQGPSRDVIEGGRGNDSISYEDHAAAVIIQDQDAVRFGYGGALPAGPPGTEDIIGGFELILGSPFVDTIVGDEGPDNLQGLAGSDSLRGGPGTDRLFGGTGDDLLDGGDDALADLVNGGAGSNRCRNQSPDTLLNCTPFSGPPAAAPGGGLRVRLSGRRRQKLGRVRVSVRVSEAANVKLMLVYTPRGGRPRALPPTLEQLRANQRAVLTLPLPKQPGTVTVRAAAKRVGATARSKPLRVTVRP